MKTSTHAKGDTILRRIGDWLQMSRRGLHSGERIYEREAGAKKRWRVRPAENGTEVQIEDFREQPA